VNLYLDKDILWSMCIEIGLPATVVLQLFLPCLCANLWPDIALLLLISPGLGHFLGGGGAPKLRIVLKRIFDGVITVKEILHITFVDNRRCFKQR
jgi:hypothetical protein